MNEEIRTSVCVRHQLPNCTECFTSGAVYTFPSALTPLGELVEAIHIFRNEMAQDRCYGHCKTYQDAIQKLVNLSKQISKG